jgi:6-phosphogluconolactonase
MISRFKILFCGILLVAGAASGSRAQKFNLLIGTYTSQPSGNPAPPKSEGIYVYEFDASNGKLTYLNKAAGLSNPSYLAIAPDNKHVYAVSEGGKGSSFISSFSYDPESGALVELNKQPSGADGACYVSIDATGKFVFAANYGGGAISAIPVLPGGTLGADTQPVLFTGDGPNKPRQDKAHLHCVVLSPDNNYLFANDLGTDRTYSFRINYSEKSSPLRPADPPFTKVQEGSGPRHITFHPNKHFAYLIHELEGAITVFSYANGKLNDLQHVSMLPQGYTGTGFTAADIHVSPDGKFLYASNRLAINEIVVYSIDQSTGKLKEAGRQSSLGKTPRNFVIDPTGNYLLAANQDSNDIFVFRRDQETGLLTPTGTKLNIAKPVCLKFSAK